jgi:hypothetical protein
MSWSVMSVSVTAKSMYQSPSCAADSSSASQDIPCSLSNLKVHCRIHKRLTHSLILNHSSAVHARHPTSWWLILILPSNLKLGLPSDIFLMIFPNKILSAPLLSHVRATCPFSSFLFWSHEWCLVQITDHKFTHYLIYCAPLLPRPS